MGTPVTKLQVPDCLLTQAGADAVRAVARERWAVYMRHSGNRVLERLGAALVVVGAHRDLEPWRFASRPGPQDRRRGRPGPEAAMAAYYARRAERVRELAERVAKIK
jgi:hypothetical protein